MQYLVSLTSKGQFTVPKDIRDKLFLKDGDKLKVWLSLKDTFLVRPKRKSKIMQFAGDLAFLDKGEDFTEIKREAQKIRANELVKRFGKQWKQLL